MASERLAFYQVFYQDEQLQHLYDFATPYRNETLTDFFENSVIADLVPETQAEYIAVCSWRLRKKRMDGWVPMLCKFPGQDDLSYDKIMREDFDVAVLTPRSGSHRMLTMAAEWHKPNWTPAINELRKFIKVPAEVKTPVYENHFIAKRELYHEYVSECLVPCMDFMRGRDVFYADSGYARKKARDKEGGGLQAVERYRQQTGREDWPIAPFILERLFSIWINDKKLKMVNI